MSRKSTSRDFGEHNAVVHPLTEQARQAGNFVFTGSQTPHDPRTGALVRSLKELPAAIESKLCTGILFIDVQSSRVRAQIWQVLQNLDAALNAHGSDLSRVVYLRVHLRDITDEPTVRGLLQLLVGTDLSAGEIVGAANDGSSDEIDIQCDAIALAPHAGERRNIHVPEVFRITAPFAPATRGGTLLFTSMIAGIDARTRDPVTRLDSLPAFSGGAVYDAGIYTRHVETFVAQHFAIWRYFQTVLSAAGLSESNIVYYKTWITRSMREASHAYLTDLFAKQVRVPFCFTRFPVRALRHPDTLVEGRIIACYPETGMRIDVKVPPHGISRFYVGAIEAGGLVITAGEVPIDTAAGKVIERASDLQDEMRLLAYGRISKEPTISVQAHFVYGLLERTLAAHGCDFDDVVHQSIYLVDASEAPAVERMASLRYGRRLPPTSIVPVVGVSPFRESRLEIEVTAHRKSKTQ